jgi:hypothetical protein
MIADLYPDGSQTAIRVLVANLQNPNFKIAKDERLDLEQFISDLQEALDNEAERQWLARNSYSGA